MSMRTIRRTFAAFGLLCGAPVWAMSLATMEAAPPIPEGVTPANLNAEAAVAERGAAGSSTLVPLMAADTQAQPIAARTVDSSVGGGMATGKPIDDMQFVKQATESGRKEIRAAQEALPQLKDPQLKHIAEMLVSDHGGANERLAQLAEAKGWPMPGPASAAEAPPAGTASSDFDARFTAEMIAGHERSAALYRAQAAAGDDKDLRKYAKDTLPTIEKHLAELRRLQK
jgi:putative membrane protein